MSYTQQIAFLLEKGKAPFTTVQSAYKSKFFIAAGFQGLLVITGTTFLTFILLMWIIE
jgi:heme/copper-type cytochrome/quinol oxidase subunit 3